MPMYVSTKHGPRMLSSEEFEAMKREEQEKLEAPAMEFAARARHADDPREAMALMAEAFHVLKNVPGVRPWDPEALYAHAFEPAATTASVHAIQFLLTLWNKNTIPSLDAESGRTLGAFDSLDALAGWDAGNRAAYVGWATDPWWP